MEVKMPSGGARSRSGPAPDPNSFRQERAGTEWLDLPRSGRDGEAPAWPLGEATETETRMWERVWRKPQAILWARDGLEDQVATYVRTFCEGALPDAPVNRRTLVRQQEGELLLNIPAMLAARVRIVADVTPSERPAVRGSSRSRLKVVDGER